MKLAKVSEWLADRPNRAHRRNWERIARVAGRFGIVYSGAYCLTTPQIALSLVGGGLGRRQEVAYAWAKVWAISPVRNWVAKNIFATKLTKRFDGGDDRYAWVGQFCWLAAAGTTTAVWSALDQRRPQDSGWYPWFSLAVRMCLASQMFYYGAAKAVPLQFQLPLAKLVEPFGNFSPMNVLWTQSAYSETYQRLLGCAEIAAGALLVMPRTANLGALLASAEMGQVLFLNLTFDVPVKIHSSHLLLLGLVLLGPESARIARFFLTDTEVAASRQQKLFQSPRANQIAAAAQIAAGFWWLATQLRNDWKAWKTYGGGQEKPPLYGIWNVDTFSCDGEQSPPLTTDGKRWRKVIIESAGTVTIQRMDDSFDNYAAVIDLDGGAITLMRMTDPGWRAALSMRRPADEELALDGEVDGHRLKIRLHRQDLRSIPLLGRGFHWVQENAYWQ